MSNEQNVKVFGVDLGTTYSCIGHVGKDQMPTIVHNYTQNNPDTTPSVVYFGESGDGSPSGNVHAQVGEHAKNETVFYPDRCVSRVKSHMHDEHWTREIDGVSWNPETVSSVILQKLCEHCSDSINEPIKNVVITVPAYFGTYERDRTKRAGEAAGLNVVELLPEPMAAALAYEMDEEEDMTVLVYDLGGGTFDVTVMKMSAQAKEALATTGDHQLGGADWDLALAKHWHEEHFPDEEFDSSLEAQLLILAENAKKQLTGLGSQAVARQSIQLEDGDRQQLTITNEEFERCTQGLLDRTMDLVEDALKIAKTKDPDLSIDTVLLVGGSTLMPAVKRRVVDHFGEDTEVKLADPHLAVVRGAALYAELREQEAWLRSYMDLEADRDAGAEITQTIIESLPAEVQEDFEEKFGTSPDTLVKGPTITGVSSRGFGIKHKLEPGDPKEYVTNLISNQQAMPASGEETFRTERENQRGVQIVCVENERLDGPSDPPVLYDEDEFLGKAYLELPAGLPAGSEVKLRVTYSNTGTVEIVAEDLTGGKMCTASFRSKASMSSDELALARAEPKVTGGPVLSDEEGAGLA